MRLAVDHHLVNTIQQTMNSGRIYEQVFTTLLHVSFDERCYD